MRLKELRELHEKKQREVAEFLHCDQSLYSKYERSEREIPLWVLINLSYFYHTSIDYLVGLTDEPSPYNRNDKYDTNS
ncbi:helix-turn-helix transcriptional regulator [Enterococcus sp.]|uniref:helix-turn-helix domain-containing protein n=1 Tax=Enterococcus sp. TaxID=35783 RepID=UPI00290C2CDE|nr:helix-turn-helix transcriptional regulator [Enterococcus sp.]MDU5337099.1 helix-turn-helix transcriptional regulator [Enterococcus sp.]